MVLVDVAAAAVGAVEGPPLAGAAGTGAADVGWAADADELPGFAGRGGGLAEGGGDAAGAGRAGGIVGIDDFGTDLGAVAERVAAAVAEPVDVVGDAADGAEGRLASADGADVGLAPVADRVAEAFGVAGLAARVCAAVINAEPAADADPAEEADPGAEADVDAVAAEPAAEPHTDPAAAPEAVGAALAADPDVVGANPGNVDPVAVFDSRACAGVAPEDVAVVFANAADVRGAAPTAGADVFEAGGVASAAEAAARGDFREPEVDVEDADVELEGAFAVEVGVDADAALGVDVAGAAERVGGEGASPEPRCETSSTGEAQVPEYAASEGAAAHEPEVEVPAEAPGAFDALDVAEPAEAVGPPDAELAAFAAADLAAAWPDVAPVAGGIPNPAGDLTESVVVDDLAADEAA